MDTDQPKGRPQDFAETGLLATLTQIALGGCAVVAFFFIDLLTLQFHNISLIKATNGYRDDLAMERAHIDLETLVKIAIVMGLITAALWLTWQLRVHANLRGAPGGPRAHPALALLVWAIPGINLIAPFLQIRRLWKAADERGWDSGPVPLRPTLWWLGWLATLGLAFAGLVAAIQAGDDPDRLMLRSVLYMAASGMAIVAAALGIWVIAGVEHRQGAVESGPVFRTWARPASP
jgi:hypothetical protein